MQKPLPKWAHTLMIVLAVVLLLLGALAWSNEYRVQSATLFSFGTLLAVQWIFMRTRSRTA